MEPHTPNPEQMLRFHVIVLRNNSDRLAILIGNNAELGFLRETVRQTCRNATTTPAGEILEADTRHQHYLETEHSLKTALERIVRREPRDAAAQFLLANSLKHCRDIISIIGKYPSTTGLASVG